MSPVESRFPRLTQLQYRNALQDLFGQELVVPAAIEPDVPVEGLLAIGATETSISAWGTERYESAAYDVAEQVVAPGPMRDAWFTCVPASAIDKNCARQVLADLGLRAWRRPLSEADVEQATGLFEKAAAELGDFYQGMAFGIAFLLQAPEFIYRVEVGSPDPSDPNRLRYDDYEMASRLSFFLWNTIPDQELLDAASRGELTTDAGIAQQSERLLRSPRARAMVRNFFSDLYQLYQLDALVKDPTIYTHMNAQLGPDAREETLRVIEHLVFDIDGDYRTLFTTQRTEVNRNLAAVYRIPAPLRDGFGEVIWNRDSQRAGILTHASLLSLYSHAVSSSATLRGIFVRRTLLCGRLLPPPTEVDPSLPEPSGDAKTLRDRVKEHLVDPVCNGCHKLTDPIGLGLENFDAIGRYRQLDNGALIDPSGDLDGTPFADPAELALAVANHPDLGPCLTRNLYRYATGRVDAASEAEWLDYLAKRLAAANFSVLHLLTDIALSPGFRYPAEPSQDSEEGAQQ